MNWAAIDPTKQEATGIGQILRVVFDDLSAGYNVGDILLADVAFGHAANGVDAVDERQAYVGQLEPFAGEDFTRSSFGMLLGQKVADWERGDLTECWEIWK